MISIQRPFDHALLPPRDRALERRVTNFLATHDAIDLARLRIVALGDRVIVAGRAANPRQHALAIAGCGRVAGVREVVDRLRVGNCNPSILPRRARRDLRRLANDLQNFSHA